MERYGLLIDTTLCLGCEFCSDACKEQNHLPGPTSQVLDAENYTAVKEYIQDHYVRQLCMHCVHPTCVSVCPVSAITKTEGGNVIYDPQICMGCRYCMQACPFSIPKYTWDRKLPVIQKCNLCWERTSQGKETACAEACPTGATTFGPLSELRKLAHKRMAANPDGYIPEILGDDEVGGTQVLYISDAPFRKLGFPANLPRKPLPDLTWAALSKVPDVLIMGGVSLFGINWVIRRRMELGDNHGEEES